MEAAVIVEMIIQIINMLKKESVPNMTMYYVLSVNIKRLKTTVLNAGQLINVPRVKLIMQKNLKYLI